MRRTEAENDAPPPPRAGTRAGTPSDLQAPETRHALDAIAELHRTDREASLAGDTETLASLWSDDPVALPPGGDVLRGREALEASLRQMREARAGWETVEYVQEFGEVRVIGDFAWDWGTYRGRSRHLETGEEVSSSGKLLRILVRATDGSWRVHRSIWNVTPPSAEGSRPGGSRP